jgi:hypothetical protein
MRPTMRTTRPLPSTALRLASHKPVGQTWLVDSLSAAWTAGKAIAALPFDALRASHASAAKAGLVQNSMLASRDFEHVLGVLERVALGPLARRV